MENNSFVCNQVLDGRDKWGLIAKVVVIVLLFVMYWTITFYNLNMDLIKVVLHT